MLHVSLGSEADIEGSAANVSFGPVADIRRGLHAAGEAFWRQRNFMRRAFDLQGRTTITFYPSPKDSEEMLRQMIVRVMAAVAAGERDAARLKIVALNGVEA